MTFKKKQPAKNAASKSNPAPIIGKVKVAVRAVAPAPVEHLKLSDLENLVKDKL